MASTDIGYLLNKATRQMRLQLASRLAEFGLRPQQAAAIMAIARSAEGRLTPGQLAESIDTDAPTTSGVVVRLERDGWVASEPNPDDGRSRLIVLTEKAEKIAPSVFAAAEAVSHEATSSLSADQVEMLGQLLERLADSSRTGASREDGTR